MNVLHVALGFETSDPSDETSERLDPLEKGMGLLHECFCPQCKSLLEIEYVRPRSLAHWEYRGHCDNCGWTDTLQRIWCDSCDQLNFGVLANEGLKCLRCESIVQLLTV